MKGKSFSKLAICLMSGMLLAGCSKSDSVESDLKNTYEDVIENADAADDSEVAENSENKSDSVDEGDPGKMSDSTDEGKSEDNSDNTDDEAEENGKSDPDLDFSDAFEEGRVYNNGHYFVGIGDKVYFRNISPEAMDEGATFGDFLHTEYHVMNCPLIAYDVNTCEWEEIGTVAGTGELYACRDGFYIGETVPEMYDASCTNLYDPVTKEKSFFCDGLPLGVSAEGDILAVEEWSGGNAYTVLYKDGKESARIGGEDIYHEYVGFAGETLITMLHSANDEYILCSVDESGEITELGLIGNMDHGYGTPKQFRFLNGDIYLCVGYYEGTGNFLSRWDVVKARPGVSDSLEVAINGDDVPSTYEGEGPDPDVPKFFFDTAGYIDYAEHVSYEAYMGDGDKGNDLFYYNDIFEECLLVKNFISTSDYENCSIIQDMETIAETVFVIYADAEADSEYDIGWRMGYRMTGWHICAIPFGYGHLDDDGLAKNIISFQETNLNRAETSDKGSDTESSNKEGDPLEGLVSDDILAEFRESNPVKNPGSIEDEARALGKWVQDNTGSIPVNISEKGEEIGQHYEFWFGTDISNNFEDNFSRIYATYYVLKDYYTSGEKNSSAFYDNVMEENKFLSDGDPENIERMYSDMQEFITDCNNMIRNR